MSAASSLPIGLGAAGVAALLLSTGTLLQAVDARQVHHRHGLRLSLIGRLLRRPRWVAGTVIGFVAFPFQLIALAHAPLVIVQPISAGGLLLLLAGGIFLLKEPASAPDFAGAAAIVAGLAIASWGAPLGTDLPVSGALFAAVVGLLTTLSLVPYLLRDRCGRVVLMLSAAVGFGGANLAVKGLSDAITRHSWAVAGAYLGAAGVSTSVSILSQMTAFQRHRAIEVLPLTYAIPIFLPAALGLLRLREHWSTAALGGAAFAIGGVLLVVGTGTVARSRSVVDISERASVVDISERASR
jgi:drug/metabolite transporter (DMT)-like permease